MIKKIISALIFLLMQPCAAALPNDFVYLKNIDPSIIQEMKYAGSDNFIGRPIPGYQAATCILTREAAEGLKRVQHTLLQKSLSLKVYDCYRPQAAVDYFVAWSRDARDQKQKANFYPSVNKADLFKLGYVAAHSGHTRGSTVDLTIVRLRAHHAPVNLNMGTHFDWMDPASHSLNPTVKGQALQHRLLLRRLMIHAGFTPLAEEWWHFTLKKEPFPTTYFNFPIE